jgi:hypothetical protein
MYKKDSMTFQSMLSEIEESSKMKDFAAFKRMEYAYHDRWVELDQEGLDLLSKWYGDERSSAHSNAWGVLHLFGLVDVLPEPENPDTDVRMLLENSSVRSSIVDLRDIVLSPNPCSEYLIVSYPKESNSAGTITIYDSSARVVSINTTNVMGIQEIDTSNLVQGIYVLKYSDKLGRNISKRFEIIE